MKVKLTKSCGLFVLLTICVTVIVAFEYNNWIIGSPVSALFAGVILPKFLASLLDLADNTNWKTSQRKLERGTIIGKKDKVRISFAYLFRIKVEGSYFLVKNSRGTGKFQPVGGVYKLNSDEAHYLKTKFYVEDDNKIPIDESSKSDYRLQLENRYLRKFVKRFNKTSNRESFIDLRREFEEELFETALLDKSCFGKLKYFFCGRHITNLAFSEHFQCYELLLADIVEIKLTLEQESMFKLLKNNNSSDYIFATYEEIKSLGVQTGSPMLQETIATHTKKILQENAESLINVKKYSRTNAVEIIIS